MWSRSWGSGDGRPRPFSRQALEVAECLTRILLQLAPRTIGLHLSAVSLGLKIGPYTPAIHERPTVTQDLGQQNGIALRSLERHKLHVGLHALGKPLTQRVEGARG